MEIIYMIHGTLRSARAWPCSALSAAAAVTADTAIGWTPRFKYQITTTTTALMIENWRSTNDCCVLVVGVDDSRDSDGEW